jgi:hypothetical protein
MAARARLSAIDAARDFKEVEEKSAARRVEDCATAEAARLENVAQKNEAREPWYARAKTARDEQAAHLAAAAEPDASAPTAPGVSARRAETAAFNAVDRVLSAAQLTLRRKIGDFSMQDFIHAKAKALIRSIDETEPTRLTADSSLSASFLPGPSQGPLAEAAAITKWIFNSSCVLRVWSAPDARATILSARRSPFAISQADVALQSAVARSRALRERAETTALVALNQEYPDVKLGHLLIERGAYGEAVGLFERATKFARTVVDNAEGAAEAAARAREASGALPDSSTIRHFKFKAAPVFAAHARGLIAQGLALTRDADAAFAASVAAAFEKSDAATVELQLKGGTTLAIDAANTAFAAEDARIAAMKILDSAHTAFSAAEDLLLEAHSACKAANLFPESPEIEVVADTACKLLAARGNFSGALRAARGYAESVEKRTTIVMSEGLTLAVFLLTKHADDAAIADAVFVRATDRAIQIAASYECILMSDEDSRSARYLRDKMTHEALLADGFVTLRERIQKEVSEAEATTAGAVVAVGKARKRVTDALLETAVLRPEVRASIPEVFVIVSLPRWARMFRAEAERCAGAGRYVDFLIAAGAFKISLQQGREKGLEAARNVFRRYISNGSLAAFTVATRRRIAETISNAAVTLVPGRSTAAAALSSLAGAAGVKGAALVMLCWKHLESVFEEPALDAAALLVESALPMFLGTKLGARFVVERMLSLGLPNWSVPQIAQLVEPARLVVITWVQRIVRGWCVRRRTRGVRRSAAYQKEMACIEAARAAEAAARAAEAARLEAEERAAEAARHAREKAIREQERLLAAMEEEARLEAIARLQREAEERARAEARRAREEEAAAEVRAPAALPGAPNSFAPLPFSNFSPPLPLLQAALEALTQKPTKPPPPPRSEVDEYGAKLAEEARVFAEAHAAAAAAAEKKELEKRAAATHISPFATSYLSELQGPQKDPVAIFHAMLGAGATEDEAWDAFRVAEKEAAEFERLANKAIELGIDDVVAGADDTLTVELAVAEARALRARSEYAAMSPHLRHFRAAGVIQRMLRGAMARWRVARIENKRWLPRLDHDTSYYYYVNVVTVRVRESAARALGCRLSDQYGLTNPPLPPPLFSTQGESRWELPKHLPHFYVTLKVVCAACAAKLATVQCTSCEEAYCESCSAALHSLPSARLRHRVFTLPTPGSPSSAFFEREALLPLDKFPGGATLATATAIERAFAGPHDGICLGCDHRVGSRYCSKCEVLYCATCWPVMHARGSRKEHVPFVVFVGTSRADKREAVVSYFPRPVESDIVGESNSN